MAKTIGAVGVCVFLLLIPSYDAGKGNTFAIERDPCDSKIQDINLVLRDDGGNLLINASLRRSEMADMPGASVIVQHSNGSLTSVAAQKYVTNVGWKSDDVFLSVTCSNQNPSVDGVFVYNGEAWVGHGDYTHRIQATRMGNIDDTISGTEVNSSDSSRRLGLQRWTNCYPDDDQDHYLDMGIAMGSRMFTKVFRSDVEAATNGVNTIFQKANVIYKQQLGYILSWSELWIVEGSNKNLPWDNPECNKTVLEQYNGFAGWVRTRANKRGLWHLFDDCYKVHKAQNAKIGREGAIAGKALGAEIGGAVCKSGGTNVGLSYPTDKRETWLVFAHEVGHNFGASHSRPGIMAYAKNIDDILINGEHQFNTNQKTKICAAITNMMKPSCKFWGRAQTLGSGSGSVHILPACVDKSHSTSCRDYKSRGYCTTSAAWMGKNCALTCDTCDKMRTRTIDAAGMLSVTQTMLIFGSMWVMLEIWNQT